MPGKCGASPTVPAMLRVTPRWRRAGNPVGRWGSTHLSIASIRANGRPRACDRRRVRAEANHARGDQNAFPDPRGEVPVAGASAVPGGVVKTVAVPVASHSRQLADDGA